MGISVVGIAVVNSVFCATVVECCSVDELAGIVVGETVVAGVVVMALVVVMSLVGLFVVEVCKVLGPGFIVIFVFGAGCSGPKKSEVSLEGDSGPEIGNGEAFPEDKDMSSTVVITLFILSISVVAIFTI